MRERVVLERGCEKGYYANHYKINVNEKESLYESRSFFPKSIDGHVILYCHTRNLYVPGTHKVELGIAHSEEEADERLLDFAKKAAEEISEGHHIRLENKVEEMVNDS